MAGPDLRHTRFPPFLRILSTAFWDMKSIPCIFLPCPPKSLLFVAWLYLNLFCESTTTEIYISHERLAHFAQYGKFFSLSFSLFVFVLNWSEDGKGLRFKKNLCCNMLVYFLFRFDVRILFCECCFVTKGVLLLREYFKLTLSLSDIIMANS